MQHQDGMPMLHINQTGRANYARAAILKKTKLCSKNKALLN
jgi:hypothetical protein